jgi:uncharacterized ion transporter superfamily protein YfcC
MGALGMAGVAWTRWIGLIWRFVLLLMLLAAAAVTVGVLTGLQ